MSHPYQVLVDLEGDEVQIDEEIVPLVQALWRMGYHTCNSCQDNFAYVWLEFASAEDATWFLNVVVAHGDDDLAYRAAHPYDVEPSDAAACLAKYNAWPDSWLIAANVNEYADGGEVYITISIRFPRQHLARVMSAMAA